MPGGCISSCYRDNHHNLVRGGLRNFAFVMEEHNLRYNFVQQIQQHPPPSERRFRLEELQLGEVAFLRHYAYGSNRPGHFYLDITLDQLASIQRYFAERGNRLYQFQIEVSLFRITGEGQIGTEILSLEQDRLVFRWTRAHQGVGHYLSMGRNYDGLDIQEQQRNNGEIVGDIFIRWQITYRLTNP